MSEQRKGVEGMSSKITPCSQSAFCSTLREFIEHDETKPGFQVWRKVEDGEVKTKGVFYQPKDKNRRRVILNRCPFCEADLRAMR